MLFILSLIPILIILFLMIGLHWGAAQAGGAGYLSALLLAVLVFGAGPELLGYAHARGLLLTLDVLLIIWAAFLLYRVVDEAGAIQTIGQALPHLTTDRGMQALVIGWAFATFLQGVGGFGVPVAIIAPLFIGLGFQPLAAVIIPSVGHAWAVTFGSLGSAFQALLATTGLPENLLAPPSALFLGIAGLASGLMVAYASGGWTAVRRLFVPVILLGLVMGTVQFLIANTKLWNTSAFSAGLAGIAASYPLAMRYRGEKADLVKLDTHRLLLALSSYVILVLVILGIQLIPAIRSFLSQVVIEAQYPELHTALGYVTPAGASRKILLFRHTGAALFYASAVIGILYKITGYYQPGAPRRILARTIQRLISPSLSIAFMVTMAVIMENAGMTDVLARGLAQGAGRLFPALAPWIGAIGAFMTGSNTNSNVVFGLLQLHTAELLGFRVPIILAGQTAGAALASALAPAKVVVGASTAGLSGQEGLIMRHLFAYIGALVLLISLLTVIWSFIIY